MPIYDCQECGYIYNSFTGDPKNGVPAEISLSDLKNTLCNMCGMDSNRRCIRDATDYMGLEAEKYYLFSGKASPLSYTDQVKGKRVLDVGAGLGRVGLSFFRHGAVVTLLEKSQAMLEVLLEIVPKSVRVIKEDLLTADLSDQQYDLVVASDGFIQHFSTEHRQILAMTKLCEALDLDGRLFIDFFIPNNMLIHSTSYKETVAETLYYFDVDCQLHLASKEIEINLIFEEVVKTITKRRQRIERLLSLVLPNDISRFLSMVNYHTSGKQFTLVSVAKFDDIENANRFKVPSDGKHHRIHYDWVQGGYPFHNNATDKVQWYRAEIKRTK